MPNSGATADIPDASSISALTVHLQYLKSGLEEIRRDMLTRADMDQLKAEIHNVFVTRAALDKSIADLREELAEKSFGERLKTVAQYVITLGGAGAIIVSVWRAIDELTKHHP
jgi:hypothetical protein